MNSLCAGIFSLSMRPPARPHIPSLTIPLGLLTLTLLPAASGQITVDTIRVKVLNGRNGTPVIGAQATVDVYPRGKYETPVPFTADRTGAFSLLIEHGGEISTRIAAHSSCEHRTAAERKQPPTRFSVARIVSTGIVSPDTCGRPLAVPQPGTLTLYVQSAPWWQRVF